MLVQAVPHSVMSPIGFFWPRNLSDLHKFPGPVSDFSISSQNDLEYNSISRK